MSFVLILYFVVASSTGAPLQVEAGRELVSISSMAACNAYGAERARKLRSDLGTAHGVVHKCVELPAPGSMT